MNQRPRTTQARGSGSMKQPCSTTDRTLAIAQDFCERTITDLNSGRATLRYETLEAFEKLCVQCGISTTRIQP